MIFTHLAKQKIVIIRMLTIKRDRRQPVRTNVLREVNPKNSKQYRNKVKILLELSIQLYTHVQNKFARH